MNKEQTVFCTHLPLSSGHNLHKFLLRPFCHRIDALIISTRSHKKVKFQEPSFKFMQHGSHAYRVAKLKFYIYFVAASSLQLNSHKCEYQIIVQIKCE